MLLNIHQPETRKRSRGFTLVELLMVISMIAIMAGMALVALRGAREDARENATEARISRIVAMLKIQFEEYEFRKLPLRLDAYVAANRKWQDASNTVLVPWQIQIRNLKRRIIADMISAEMPRPLATETPPGSGQFVFSFNPNLGFFPTADPSTPNDPTVSFEEWLELNYPTPVAGQTLLQALQAVRQSKLNIWQQVAATGDPNFNLPGEYLYAILRFSNHEDTPALEGLSPNAVGDSDNDGYFEIVDSWGDPLIFDIGQLGQPMPVNFKANPTLWIPPVPGPTSGSETVHDSPTEGSDIFENDGVTVARLNSVVPSPIDEIFLTLSSQNIQ